MQRWAAVVPLDGGEPIRLSTRAATLLADPTSHHGTTVEISPAAAGWAMRVVGEHAGSSPTSWTALHHGMPVRGYATALWRFVCGDDDTDLARVVDEERHLALLSDQLTDLYNRR